MLWKSMTSRPVSLYLKLMNNAKACGKKNFKAVRLTGSKALCAWETNKNQNAWNTDRQTRACKLRMHSLMSVRFHIHLNSLWSIKIFHWTLKTAIFVLKCIVRLWHWPSSHCKCICFKGSAVDSRVRHIHKSFMTMYINIHVDLFQQVSVVIKLLWSILVSFYYILLQLILCWNKPLEMI